MLARDPIEAAEQAQSFLKERTLADYYEEILMGALTLAWADAQRGRLDEQQAQRIRDTVSEIVEDLEVHKDSKNARSAPEEEGALSKLEQLEKAAPLEAPQSPSPPDLGGAVLCIPGLGLLDEAVAIVLAQLLRRDEIFAQAKEAGTLSMSKLFGLETENVALICLCYLEHVTPAQMHHASRRIRRKTPGAFILVGVFNESEQTPPHRCTAAASGRFEFLEGPLSAGVTRISEILSRPGALMKPGQTPTLAKIG
jgi:hypothetical protein